MFKFLITGLAMSILSGCGVGIVTVTRTLQEPPFAIMQMRGDITEATRCVGRYWQNEANNLSVFWSVWTYSYQVHVQGYPGDTAPIGLIIDFQDQAGKTFAFAHLNSLFANDDTRRNVTLKALDACKAS